MHTIKQDNGSDVLEIRCLEVKNSITEQGKGEREYNYFKKPCYWTAGATVTFDMTERALTMFLLLIFKGIFF